MKNIWKGHQRLPDYLHCHNLKLRTELGTFPMNDCRTSKWYFPSVTSVTWLSVLHLDTCGINGNSSYSRQTFRAELPTYAFCGLISGGHRFNRRFENLFEIVVRHALQFTAFRAGYEIIGQFAPVESSRRRTLDGVLTADRKYNYPGLMIQIERASFTGKGAVGKRRTRSKKNR